MSHDRVKGNPQGSVLTHAELEREQWEKYRKFKFTESMVKEEKSVKGKSVTAALSQVQMH